MKKTILLALTLLTSAAFAQNAAMNPTLNNAMNQAKNGGGDFNARIPNPFVFCAAPKPSKHNPLRIVWEQVCPSGNAQAAAAPVPVPTVVPRGNVTNNTMALQQQFNQSNQINQGSQINQNYQTVESNQSNNQMNTQTNVSGSMNTPTITPRANVTSVAR